MTTIIEALGGEAFLAQAFGRTYKRFQLGTAPDALTWTGLNHLLTTHRLEAPRLRLARDGAAIPMQEYCQRRTYRRMPQWHAPLPHTLAAQLRDGATMVVDAIDEMHPPIRALAAALEQALRTSVQVNAYASWTTTEGFGVHWDDHPVVILQVEGAKDWRVYGPTRPAPMFRDVVFDETPPTDPIAEFTLRAGDGLYLPRGWWHAAATAPGEHSLHLTFGLTSHTGVDLLTWIVDGLRDTATARAEIPWFAGSGEQSAWLDGLRTVLEERLAVPDLIKAYRTARDSEHEEHQFALPYAVTMAIPADATVRLTTPRAVIEETGDAVIMQAAGQRWTLHSRALPVLHRLRDNTPVTVAALADHAGLAKSDVQGLLAELLTAGILAVDTTS